MCKSHNIVYKYTLIQYNQTRCYPDIMKFLCDSLVILMSWQKFVVVLGTNLHPQYVPISGSTYSYLHIDIFTYRCKSKYVVQVIISFYSHIKGDTHIQCPKLIPEVYLITIWFTINKITCHRIIISSLLAAANNAVNKMLAWADHRGRARGPAGFDAPFKPSAKLNETAILRSDISRSK